MRTLGAAALALWVLLANSAAFAADYPFSGFFAMTPPGEDQHRSQLRCAYGFFIQGKDGSYVNYHLVLPRFVDGGAVRFVDYGRGSCSIDASGKIESCLATFDADPSVQGKTFIDVFRQLDAGGVIDLFYFDTIAQAQAFAAAGPGSKEPASRYSICSGFDAASMAKYLSTDRSTLSPDDRMKMISPELDDATMAIMTRVLETIGADKKE
jgi:hypothetical protein